MLDGFFDHGWMRPMRWEHPLWECFAALSVWQISKVRHGKYL
ncbi:hypothetical protein [Pistricoccus aurantiacus]|nr:hypothetical protein [Pistricoccus aurantiacus]